MNYDFLHEIERVKFRSPVRRPTSELLPVFQSLGFTVYDDVLSLDRNDKVPPWQSSTIVSVHVLCDSREVFGFDEEEWNSIQLEYLYATLPFDFTNIFVDVSFAVSEHINLPVEYDERSIDKETLRKKMTQIRETLMTETGEDVGSEALAILIHSTYPRR